jgi:hypothetical protein
MRPALSKNEKANSLPERLRSLAGCDARAGAPLGQMMEEAADRIEQMLAALHEARLQLEYMDERSPSGTTPAALARVNDAIAKAESPSNV